MSTLPHRRLTSALTLGSAVDRFVGWVSVAGLSLVAAVGCLLAAWAFDAGEAHNSSDDSTLSSVSTHSEAAISAAPVSGVSPAEYRQTTSRGGAAIRWSFGTDGYRTCFDHDLVCTRQVSGRFQRPEFAASAEPLTLVMLGIRLQT
jgi:hypothetical protein